MREPLFKVHETAILQPTKIENKHLSGKRVMVHCRPVWDKKIKQFIYSVTEVDKPVPEESLRKVMRSCGASFEEVVSMVRQGVGLDES